MGTHGLTGRRTELDRLEKMLGSRRAEFLAVYGRRRVGKTFLINRFFRPRCRVFEVTGVQRGGLATQLKSFTTELKDVFLSHRKLNAPSNWLEAFDALRKAIAKVRKKERIVLFFDELPWLATQRSGCLEALAHFWNRYASRDQRIIVIVCGSSTSWMLKKVISDRGGLHGRLTHRMRLLPFTLSETEEMLLQRGVTLDRRQITSLYMAWGGVPKYLELARPGRSAAQLIDDECFTAGGYLADEFQNLYAALFDRSAIHMALIQALSKRTQGLTMGVLAKAAGISPGGRLSRALTELQESGFVTPVPAWGARKKGIRYRLSDEYSLFYLRWIDRLRISGRPTDVHYWLKKQSSSAYASWAGFAFEGVCMKHVPEIKQALGIAGLSTRAMGWAAKPSDTQPGVQIDLVIDRDDHCVNLFEIKFHRTLFRVTRSYAKKLADKRDRFLLETGTKKTVFVTMLTAHGVEENQHYRSVVANQLTVDALFGESTLQATYR